MATSELRSGRGHVAVPAAVAVLATLGELPFLGKSLWIDEAASLYSAHLSWSGLWRQSHVVDRVYLLYYSFLHLWVHVDGSIEWLRLPSLLAFGLTVFLVGRIGIRFGGLWCGALAAVLIATSPLMVIAALDARPYALATLAATTSIWALVRWFDEGTTKWAWLFCVATIVTLLLQMFSVLVPFVVLVVAIWLRPSLFRSKYRGLLAPIGLALLTTAVFVLLVAGQRAQISWIFPVTIKNFATDVVETASGNLAPGLAPVYFAVVVLITVVALVNSLWTWRRGRLELERRTLEMLAVSLAWAASITLGLLVISIVTSVFYNRYLTASVPGLALFVATLTVLSFRTTSTSSEHRWRTLLAGSSFLVVVLVLVANSLWVSNKIDENLKGTASYLASHLGSNAEIALPSHGLSSGIEYYLSSSHESLATWPQSRTVEQVLGLDLNLGKQALSMGRENVWLVDDGTTDGLRSFTAALAHSGYVQVGSIVFGTIRPVTVVHFHREHKAHL